MNDRLQKHKTKMWLGLGLAAGFVAGFKMWRQYKARQNSPLIREGESFWALVTGASSGIGAVYARRLAKRGYNLVLVARRKERLDTMAEELVTAFRVKVRVLTADLSTTEGIEQVEALLAAMGNLNILVNNAGFGSSGQFAKKDIEVQDSMIHLHVVASVRLTRAALPVMLEQKRGAIVNVSSLMAFFPLSGGATYSATKSYLNAFTEALHQELAGSGVRVQALCPGFTRTEFQTASGIGHLGVPEPAWMKPESVVDRSLRDLENARVISVPGVGNRFLSCCAPFIPRAWIYAFGRRFARLRSTTGQPFTRFRKRTWGSFSDFVGDMRKMAQNRQRIQMTMQTLDRGLMRRLMLVVTHVNGCRYCANYHAKSALMDGMTPEEVDGLLDGAVDNAPADEIPALLYAQYWAEAGGRSDTATRSKVVEIYGEKLTSAIEGALQMIQMGNYTGNALDYLLFTISGGRWGNETR